MKEAKLSQEITIALCTTIDMFSEEHMSDMSDPIVLTAISELAVVYLGELKKKYPDEIYRATKIQFLNRIAEQS